MIKLIDILVENSNKTLQHIADSISNRLYCHKFGSCVHFAEIVDTDIEDDNKTDDDNESVTSDL